MFKNVGAKLQVVGEVVFWLGTAISLIIGIVAACGSDLGAALPSMLLGIATSYILGLALAGLGELVVNSNRTVELLEKQSGEAEEVQQV